MSPRAIIRRLARDEDGSVLVEFGAVLAIFLLLLFGMIDFGRLGFSYVMAEKATERAVRMAAVRPAACAGLPELNLRAGAGFANGTLCTAATGLCVSPGTVSCAGTSGNPVAAEIWAAVRPLMPVNARVDNLRFSYGYDPALNRLGAAYAPVVTVEIDALDFNFISPLGALAAMAGARAAPGLGASIAFPSMSASLPAEDLR